MSRTISTVYHNLDPNIRIAVRAYITRGQSVLVQHKVYEDGSERFVLPGGAPEVNETLEQGLQRECREEIGTSVQVVELLHVADLFRPRSNEPSITRHQLEMVFCCEVPETYEPRNGSHPDKHQVDVIWLDNTRIHQNFWPTGLARVLFQQENIGATYLGLIE